MAESFTRTAPVVVTETTDTYTVVAITMDSERAGVAPTPAPPPAPPPVPPFAAGFVSIVVKDNLGVLTTLNYVGEQAQNLIKFINTGNFSVKSLHKRILEYLSTSAAIPGAVGGTPDVPTAPTGLE